MIKVKQHIIRLKAWKIAAVILGILLIVSVFTGGFSKTKDNALAGQAVAEKSIGYVNKYLLAGQATAELKEIEELDGIYNMKLMINGREFSSYATKDGKLFFPQAVNLDEAPEEEIQPEPESIPKKQVPEVKLFTMSFCPYGNQAEEAMMPVAELLKDRANIEPHYVIYSNYRGGGPEFCLDEENKYCSMHGIQELNQDVRELCVYKYQKEKYWDFIARINEKCSAQNADKCWEAIAAEAGIDAGKIKACQKDEAINLLENEIELNKKYDVSGSPALVINDVDYNGMRAPEAYKQAVCSAFSTEPGECSKTLGEGAASPIGGCES